MVMRNRGLRAGSHGARLGTFSRQFDAQFACRFQRHRPFDRVLQLPDIARPVVTGQSFERRRFDAVNALSRSGRIFLQKVIRQQRNILAALAQARHANGNDVQAIVEVLAERAFGDLPVEIAVGGGDDADVNWNFAGAAHRTDGAFLEHAQQFDLHGHGHLADFVEKNRALVGDFEQPAPVLVRSSEGAFDVTEEFAFEQRLRKRAAVNRDKSFGGSRRTGMDGPRNEFFTGSAFAVRSESCCWWWRRCGWSASVFRARG